MEFSILWLQMIFLLRISLLLKRKIRQASLASSSSSSIEFAPLPVMTPDRRLRVPASKDTRYPVICHHRDQIQFLMQLEPLQLRLLPPKPWTPDLLPLRPLAPTTAHLPNTAISPVAVQPPRLMDPYAAAFGRGFGTTSLGTEAFVPEYLPLVLRLPC